MTTTPDPVRTVGELLRYWRKRRSLSQLELSTQAEVSTRHLSFLETGRSEPSRPMLLRLARYLDLPPRERNALLDAAGFAAAHRETPLTDPQMRQALEAVELLLKRQEPFPAAVVDQLWDLRMINQGWQSMSTLLSGARPKAYALLPEPRANVMRTLFAPDGLRNCVPNWPDCARIMLDRLMRERARAPQLEALVSEVLAMPQVAPLLEMDRSRPSDLLVPMRMNFGEETVDLISTITTLGTPQDLTLAELHIESFHPASPEDETKWKALLTQLPAQKSLST